MERCSVRVLGSRMWGSGFRFRVQGSGFRVHGSGSEFKIQGSWFRVQGSGFRVQVQGSECRVQGSGCRVQCSGFRVQGAVSGDTPRVGSEYGTYKTVKARFWPCLYSLGFASSSSFFGLNGAFSNSVCE